MVEISSTYRKDHLFRQLSLTPLTKAEWLTAKILWYIVLTVISAAIMIAVGVGAFGAHVRFCLGLLPFLVLGPFFFVSLGMLAGSVAKTPESAAVLGNIITFPMMFLSGTFFPVSSFPTGLQTVAHALPLYYVIDGMNQVMLFHNNARAAVDLADHPRPRHRDVHRRDHRVQVAGRVSDARRGRPDLVPPPHGPVADRGERRDHPRGGPGLRAHRQRVPLRLADAAYDPRLARPRGRLDPSRSGGRGGSRSTSSPRTNGPSASGSPARRRPRKSSGDSPSTAGRRAAHSSMGPSQRSRRR